MNLEKCIIEHCAPTLAGIKTASLFTLKFDLYKNLQDSIDAINLIFNMKGVFVMSLRENKNTALIYVYRENMLSADIQDSKAKEILQMYGYLECCAKKSLERLADRLHSFEEFPHEIGLFLGYPPDDVEGFICHKGQNCNFCGYWKVYGDTEDAIQKFAQYDKCRAIYKKLWAEGRDILRLTVKKTKVA